MDTVKQKVQRRANGTFAPGHSVSVGNKGGSGGDKCSNAQKETAQALLCETLDDDQRRELLNKFVDMAMADDSLMAKSLLDRLIPALKPRPAPIIVPDFDDSSPVDMAKSIVAAAGTGKIDTDSAAVLIRMVADLVTISNDALLSDRVEELGQALNALK